MAESSSVDSVKDIARIGEANYWDMQMGLADFEEQDWRERAEKIINRYLDERDKALAEASQDNLSKINILWSNTETLKAALGSGEGDSPNVRRRHADASPVAREVAEIVERVLSYSDDESDTEGTWDACLEDFLLPGRAVCWLEYEPTIETAEATIDPMTGLIVPEREFIAEQSCQFRHIHWDRYRQSPARSWKETTWVSRLHMMTRDDVAEQFGADMARRIPYQEVPAGMEKSTKAEKHTDALKKARVWEIWDGERMVQLFFVRGFPDLLGKTDDPYGLHDFFPMPEPAMAVRSNKSMVPTPEFTMYQDQAGELDRLTTRISRTIEGIKRRGVYDATFKDALQNLVNAADNQFYPVETWSEIMAKGGLAAVFMSEDIKPAVDALQVLYVQRAQLVQEIFETVGIADIMRGSTNPNETLGAQRLKAQFGSAKVRVRRKKVEKMKRDAYRLKAELVAEHYEPNVLQEISGLPVSAEAMALMRSERLKGYKIDVETDTTALEDEAETQERRTQFLGVVGELMTQFAPLAQQGPEMAKLASELVMFGLRGFKAGRQLEESVERALMSFAQGQGGQRQPSPEEIKAQIEQMKMQLEAQKLALQAAEMRQSGQIDLAKIGQDRAEMETDAMLELRRQNLDAMKAIGQA